METSGLEGGVPSGEPKPVALQVLTAGEAAPSGGVPGTDLARQRACGVPTAGVYGLTMRIATPNRDQVLNLTVGADRPIAIQIPNTTGLWGTTKEVSVELNGGTQTLRFSAPYQRGVAVRWFELKPK